MAKAGLKDLYANRAFESVTMSAANALTFSQVQFGVGLFQGVAAIIHRIEWTPTQASIAELVAGADRMRLGFTNRDDLAALTPVNQSVLAWKFVFPLVVGAVVSEWLVELPLLSDFSDLPGGGLILPANPLYIGMDTEGFAAAGGVDAVIYLTFKQLQDAEYVELIQTIMPANL